MELKPPFPYVARIDDEIYIKNIDSIFRDKIESLSGTKFPDSEYPDRLIIKFVNEHDLILGIDELRNIGICFSMGPGWSPSAQFEDYREKGLLFGKYKRIGWSGPGKFTIDEV